MVFVGGKSGGVDKKRVIGAHSRLSKQNSKRTPHSHPDLKVQPPFSYLSTYPLSSL